MPFRTIGALSRAAAATALLLASALGVSAAPYLVLDAATGETILEKDATTPWYPASLTKLMTTYVALDAVRQGRLTMDTPLTMSTRAARMAPSKMGFEPGTEVTLENALKMLMVKSPNDIAVMVAESLSGSVEDFADEMNATARKLGLRESHFVNPNGLHDPNHYSSARDMALVARALLTDFPEQAGLFNISAMQLDDAIITNHNGMLGHYPGADGMKTGFTCSSGFNIVASATHDGHKLIAVVLGAPSTRERNIEAAALFERGFSDSSRGPKLGDLAASAQRDPRDMRSEVCSRRNAALVAEEQVELEQILPQLKVAAPAAKSRSAAPAAEGAAPMISPARLLAALPVQFNPVPVYVGPKPGWTGPVLAARVDPNAPSEAAAYTTSTAPNGNAAEGEGEGAPQALKGAVKPASALVPKKQRAQHLAPHRHPVAAKAEPKAKAKAP
jgi:D-alanyl-D-alanine carboxypeptidase